MRILAAMTLSDVATTLQDLQNLTGKLTLDPYSVHFRERKAAIYSRLQYPDLAAGEYYKILLLLDELLEESGEYHDEALQSFLDTGEGDENAENVSATGIDLDNVQRRRELNVLRLVSTLIIIGCLRSATEYLNMVSNQRFYPLEWASAQRELDAATQKWLRGRQEKQTPFEVKELPDTGLVRREVYPWNSFHEGDRSSLRGLDLLNQKMRNVAPKLEVANVKLPLLTSDGSGTDEQITQLGVVATEDIGPGEEVLIERSILTANTRLHEPLCDACSASLSNPENDTSTSYSCDACVDTVFCSEACLNLAQKSYHPAVCDAEVDAIVKEVPRSEAVDALYTQLLFRALAMAQTQECHALDLMEVKYIWGDFVLPETSGDNAKAFDEYKRTLPFSFNANVLHPFHFLEKCDINPFTDHLGLAEVSVYNTLYAKFRGTASARISHRDGRPEVAAVHPMWCLANHSCDPNVSWEWAGEIRFTTISERVVWTEPAGSSQPSRSHHQPGIRKGEEVLNHYVDIHLPVDKRREWGAGALGGTCMCDRCMYEATGKT